MRRRIYRKAHRTLKPPISKQHKAKTKNHKNLPICYAALNSGLHFPLIYAATPQLSLFLSAVSLPRSPPQPPPPWPPIITPKTNPTSTKSSPSASSSFNPSKPNSSPNASLSPPIPSSTSLQKNPNPNPRIFYTHSILILNFFFYFEGLRCRMGLWRKGRSGWHRHWTLREIFRRVWLPTLWFLRSMGFSGTCLGLWSLIVSSSSSLLNPTKAATLSGTPALTFSARYDLCIVDFSHLGFFLKRKFECLA